MARGMLLHFAYKMQSPEILGNKGQTPPGWAGGLTRNVQWKTNLYIPPPMSITPPPPRDDGSPTPGGTAAKWRPPPPPRRGIDTINNEQITAAYYAEFMTDLLLAVRRPRLLNTHRHTEIEWCHVNDSNKQNSQYNASVHQFAACPYC